MSAIIPFIRMLERSPKKHHDDSGVQTMKQEMLVSLKQWYAGAECNEILTISTAHDPRFKDKFFRQPETTEEVKSILNDKVAKLKSTESDAPIIISDASTEDTEALVLKHPKTTLLECFSEILEEAGASVNDLCNEVEIYLSEPLIEFHGRDYMLKWWATNKVQFPSLAKLARKYAPPTSVPSERLFSTAGDLYDEKHNRLSPQHAEELLFIKTNLHF